MVQKVTYICISMVLVSLSLSLCVCVCVCFLLFASLTLYIVMSSRTHTHARIFPGREGELCLMISWSSRSCFVGTRLAFSYQNEAYGSRLCP